ncbi:Hypothetical predicted protein [Pelobates cultripes]|uniref:Uncharacterized protein n=1 Tax=Pelobates cultripes TaxID=61616 RepID=A0AAD1RBW6_PELCU|nr:Hypothetical predicted protein [Pelobates cultripes]
MTKILLVVCITLAIYQDDCFGKLFDRNQEFVGVTDAGYPDTETLVKRNSYQVLRNADRNTINWPERPSNCYLVHEGQMESQISCRLRFTRSKFNFNPFGLRFGKRGSDRVDPNPALQSATSKFLPFLLKLKEWPVFPCRDEPGENC